MHLRAWAAMAAALVLASVAPNAVADTVGVPTQTWVPDGEVEAVAVSGSTAYIGGNFSRIAPYTGSSVRFDASTSAREKPWPEVNGVVNAVAADGTGGWYLGGDFHSVGGVARTDLAHVLADGTLDPTWAPTTDGLVRTLAVGGGTVFAGGQFSTAGGAPRGNLAGFSTATGAVTSFIGSVSFSGSPFDPVGVHALLLVGSTLYVTGEFNQAQSGVAAATRLRGVAFGVADSQIQSWNPSTNRLINGLARDPDGADLFIGGRFSRVNVTAADPFNTGQTRNAVAKVDEAAGTVNANWVTPLQQSTDLSTLMVSGTWVYLAGTVRVAPGQVWPVAAYNTVNNNAGLNINWHPVPTGSVQSLAAAGSTVYIGSGSLTDGLPQPAIMGVDATDFPDTGTPSFAPALGRGRQAVPSGQATGVRAIGATATDVVAGGTFTNAGGVARRNLAAIDLTTGQATAFDPPMLGPFSALAAVHAVTVTSDGLVWAGGEFATAGPQERLNLAAFDAGTGAITSFHRDPNAAVLALAASGTTVYAGGAFTQVGGQPRRGLAALTNVPGEAGTVLPFDADVAGQVNALAPAGGSLYIGGSFTSINGALAALRRDRRNLAAVDPTTGLARDWDPDADGAVRALAAAGDTIFAGGDFATVNRSTPRQRLAAFDLQGGTARAWAPGADAPVRALAPYGPTVFAGGDFANAGSVSRSGFAALDAVTGAADPSRLDLSTEERSGPSAPPITRVGALVASQDLGLLAGGTFVMNAPAPRAANLATFALPPLPSGGGGDGTPAGGAPVVPPGPAGTTARDTTRPTLRLTASRRRFRVGRASMPARGNATASAKRAGRGTTLRLTLSERAQVRLDVLRTLAGRRAGKRCVKPARANRNRKRCTRLIARATFTRSVPAGRSRVPWSGRIGRRALPGGRYVLRATPTDTAGNRGAPGSLAITIVR